MTPDGVIRPILLFCDSVNQTLPSGPAVIELPRNWVSAWGSGNSVTTPCGVILPILSKGLPPVPSVNQTLPSGPRVRAWGVSETGKGVRTPDVVSCSIWPDPPDWSANQRFWSDPVVIPPRTSVGGRSTLV